MCKKSLVMALDGTFGHLNKGILQGINPQNWTHVFNTGYISVS